MKEEWYVEIRKYANEPGKDDEVINRMGPFGSESQAERTENGCNINLNHGEFYTELVLGED